MTPYVIGWVILGVGTLSLAIYRILIALHEDDCIHLAAGEERQIPQQIANFRKIERIDRWGISLTVLTAAVGLGLAAVYLFEVWMRQYRF